jgi:serine/threonine protein phosphatase PrpC
MRSKKQEKINVSMPPEVFFQCTHNNLESQLNASNDDVFEVSGAASHIRSVEYVTVRGVRGRKENEDRFFVSDSVADVKIASAFEAIIEETKNETSASTAVVLTVRTDGDTIKIQGGFIGDSTALFCVRDKVSQKCRVERVFLEHSLELHEENRVGGSDVEHLHKLNLSVVDGQIVNEKGYGCELSLIRAIGGAAFKHLRREYEEFEYIQTILPGYEYKLIVCSDGALEKMTLDEIADIMQKQWNNKPATHWKDVIRGEKSCADDITIVSVDLPVTKDLAVGVFDGNQGTVVSNKCLETFARHFCPDVSFTKVSEKGRALSWAEAVSPLKSSADVTNKENYPISLSYNPRKWSSVMSDELDLTRGMNYGSIKK